MGLRDEIKLIEIKEFANGISDYNFVHDNGDWSNSIMISEKGKFIRCAFDWRKADYEDLKSKGWWHGVPDCIDWDNKIIIEYQESAKKTGKHTVKGHDELSDADKDLYYELAGFRQIKIWDYDKDWKTTLENKLKIAVLRG